MVVSPYLHSNTGFLASQTCFNHGSIADLHDLESSESLITKQKVYIILLESGHHPYYNKAIGFSLPVLLLILPSEVGSLGHREYNTTSCTNY